MNIYLFSHLASTGRDFVFVYRYLSTGYPSKGEVKGVNKRKVSIKYNNIIKI